MKHLDSRLTLEILQQHFGMRLSEVSAKFGCCPTLLKQHCRKLGIERWPYRTASKVEKKRKRLRQKYGEQTWTALESKLSAPLTTFGENSLQTLKQLEEAAEASQGDKRRVKIWNRIKKQKTAGMAAPFASSLVGFLESHPECEVYNGQDLRPEPAASSCNSCEDRSAANAVQRDCEPNAATEARHFVDPLDLAWSADEFLSAGNQRSSPISLHNSDSGSSSWDTGVDMTGDVAVDMAVDLAHLAGDTFLEELTRSSREDALSDEDWRLFAPVDEGPNLPNVALFLDGGSTSSVPGEYLIRCLLVWCLLVVACCCAVVQPLLG